MQPTPKEKTFAIALALGGAVLFSSKAVMVKLAYQYEVDSISLLLLRMGFALPIYLFIAFNNSRKETEGKIKKRDWLAIIFLGIIGYYMASFLDFWGLEYITASLERLILFIYPTITTLFAAIYFKRKIEGAKIIAIVLSYVGIIIAFWDKINQDTNDDFWLGAALIFGSAVTFSIYLVGSENLIPKFGATKFTTYCMIVSCLSVLAHIGISQNADFLNFPWQVYALGLFIAVFNTVVPSYMMSFAIKTIGASTTSILSSVGPIAVLILGYFLLEENISVYQIAGTMVVIGGVLLISSKNTNK